MLAESVWLFTLLCLLLLSAVFVFVIANSGEKQEYTHVQKQWYQFRSKWIVFLASFGVLVVMVTLFPFPISSQAGIKNVTVVNVVGYQWYWEIDNTHYNKGETIEFHVTSGDANHGFGIYNEKDQLLTQTQAMPDYVNKLVHTFDQPGTYKVLCMEYCGMAHHGMLAELIVE